MHKKMHQSNIKLLCCSCIVKAQEAAWQCTATTVGEADQEAVGARSYKADARLYTDLPV
jgi:hypothetical protein